MGNAPGTHAVVKRTGYDVRQNRGSYLSERSTHHAQRTSTNPARSVIATALPFDGTGPATFPKCSSATAATYAPSPAAVVQSRLSVAAV